MEEGGGIRSRIPNTRVGLAFMTAVAVTLGLFVIQRFYSPLSDGPRCSDLAAPLGGNNRSVIAFKNDQRGALDLKLRLDKEQFRVGEPLTVHLTFVNESSGPLILHLNLDGPIITTDPAVDGVTFEITRVGAGAPIANQPRTYQSPTTFSNFDTLHLLGARTRCTETYTFSPADLAAIGIAEGEYRIRASYRNDSPGDPRPIQPVDATATPYPQYATTQGVWVGETRSNEERFAIGGPG
ncbi:MAG: hypothetical protein Kow00106_04930 [Anaerolineae bacterium]